MVEEERIWSNEELLKILDDVEKEPKRKRSTESKDEVSNGWSEKKIQYAKNAIRSLDDSIRGVCILNWYTSVDNKADIIFRINKDKLFVQKPAFGRYEIDEEVWEYLKKRVLRMMRRIEDGSK